MRVLAVINALGEGGTERSHAELLSPLAERGVDVTTAILRSRGDEGFEPRVRREGHRVVRLPGGPRLLPAFRRVLDREAPDLLHSMLFDADITARVGSIGSGVPLLTSLVNTSYSSERVATTDIPRAKLRIVQGIDAVTARILVTSFHAVSEAVKDHAVRHLRISPSKITVVRRGRQDPQQDLSRDAGRKARAALGIPPGDLVVLSIGRHELQKDHCTLIRSMVPLMETDDRIWLLVAGREGVETPALVAETSAEPAATRVRLLGHRGDIPALLGASDLVALTSRYEGMPGSVIEAMAAGRPVVASDIPPVTEVVEPGGSALLAPAGDVAGFTAVFRALLADPSLRQRLGERGREIFQTSFTIEASADGMAALYGVVASRGRRGR